MYDPTRREFAEQLGAGLIPARTRREPSYLHLERTGELARRAKALYEYFRSCRLCPRSCGVNRLKNERGVCGASSRVKVYSAGPHHGEERPLSGRGGSGTIFFSHCNLLCCFCQNWQINHRGDGENLSDERLGRMMVDLQNRGCHNINLVTPTHVVPNIVQALRSAIPLGLRVPLVYNCGGYEPVHIIRLLDSIVDIYLPDYKYTDGANAARYSSGAADYPAVAAEGIGEMHRQVGELQTDDAGIAQRGLMIRHLVLPNNIAGTDKFVQFVAGRLTPATYVNIMAQYRPMYRAREYPELSRPVTRQEFEQALAWARQAGLTRLDRG